MAKVIKPKKATQAGMCSCFERMHASSGRKVKEVETTSEWREKVLWAMYAMAGGYMTKPQRERFHVILKKMADGVWYPSLTEMWIQKGQKLKAHVLGGSSAMSRKDLGRDAVGNKYAIYDPLTGEPKHGKYFVLRIDAKDPLERAAVRSALQTYVAEQEKNGRHEYAGNVCEFVGAAR